MVEIMNKMQNADLHRFLRHFASTLHRSSQEKSPILSSSLKIFVGTVGNSLQLD